MRIAAEQALVGQASKILKAHPEGNVAIERAEQDPEAAIAAHQSIVGIPQGKAFGHRLGRLDQLIAGGLQSLENGLEPRHHAVERPPDARHLIGPGRRHPNRQVAAGDPIGGDRERAEPPGQKEAHDRADDRDRDHADDGDADAKIAGFLVGSISRADRRT